uniref:RNA-directed DNA polymerase, eukaryota, reverse transcriptase zinc-binding domain protein n=1 Tax=Tanacetum cinerariifolium TaxID=118510 RepID=A0A6L2KQP7_TANCI|nr:RNA-directed DNA polymerase, eukaryota, reverse transcriptase zinc-binding domain protein [Tanacetum cinerariifolium]
MVFASKDPLKFNDLMATPIYFSKYVLNGLKIENLTQYILLGPAFNLLKGTCSSSIKLEYNFQECLNDLTNKLDWNNLKGDHYPFDLSKHLPLHGLPGHRTIAADYFFNNDLEYLKTSDPEVTYTTSIMKTKAARYEVKGTEDLVILSVKSVSVKKLHGYGHLEEIVVKRYDQQLYKFKERDFVDLHINDIKDTLLVVQHKLFHLNGSDIVDIIMALHLDKQKRVLRADELYKLSDGTLKSVRDEIHYRVLEFCLNYNPEMPKRKWTAVDRKRSGLMIDLINKQLHEREIIKNLERLVGAKELEMDYKLMTQVEVAGKDGNKKKEKKNKGLLRASKINDIEGKAMGKDGLLRASKINDIEGKAMGKDGNPLRRAVHGVHGVNDNDKGYSNEKMNIGTGSNKNNESLNDTSVSNPVTLTSTNNAPTNTSHAHDVIRPEMVTPSVNFGFGKEDEFWSSSKSPIRSVYEVTEGGETIRSDFYEVSSSDGTKENGNPDVTSSVSTDKNMLVNGEHVNMENGWAAPVNEFHTTKGMEQVLEQGPWLIRNISLILTKWTLNLTLSKDKMLLQALCALKLGVWWVPMDLNESETQHNIGDPSTIMIEEAKKVQTDESDSEVDKDIIVETKKYKTNGASTPSSQVLNLSMCAILESHVEISRLSQVCSKVFKGWDWTSNASYCRKGCRIILGWNTDVVNVVLIAQTDQAMHIKIFHKATNTIIYGSIIYASNCNIERRQLWDNLNLHKRVTRGNSWILMGDFNGAYGMFQPYRLSYHSPAVIKIPSLMSGKPKPFKFSNFLAYKNEFQEVVTRYWSVQINGYRMYQITAKLKALKKLK